MGAAARVLPADWLEELERILKRSDTMPGAARDAVRSVVQSFLNDPHTTEREITHATVLLARHEPR